MKFSPMEPADLDFFRSLADADRVSTGESILNLHAYDQSRHGPLRPEAVFWPVSTQEVAAVLAHCSRRSIPVTAWGAGTSLEGNPLPAARGLVLDFTRMNRILDIRAADFQADVEPGVIYQDLNEKLRHLGLFFPPDPGARATLGGMIANNASGTRTVRYGSTRNYVRRLEVVLADGQIIHTGTRASKTSSGYDLTDLFVGSEGTLGVVVGATVGLAGAPVEYSAAVGSFNSVVDAAQAVFEIIRAGLQPAALELLDRSTANLLNREDDLTLPDSPSLLMEFHGPSKSYLAEVLSMAEETVQDNGGRDFRPGLGRDERDRIWRSRHHAGEAVARAHPGHGVLIVDAAVPISRLPELIVRADEEVKQSGLPGYIFGHAGDGNIHVLLLGRINEPQDWKTVHRTNEAIVKYALNLGGTVTGEHGVGLGKKKFMDQEHGLSLDWMRKIKGLFDPQGILNPGKCLPSDPLGQD